MVKDRHYIMGVHITDRVVHAGQVQSLLTEYGSQIKTRLGLHEVSGQAQGNGLLILEMVGDLKRCDELKGKLNAIVGIEAKTLEFDHPA